jgi:hypothetical protein
MNLTGQLFPVHPKPFKDEVLTSWLIRLAKSNGMKVQTFNRIVFDSKKQLWNRDMDRASYQWLLDKLSEKTSIKKENLYQLTLESYQQQLYNYFSHSGILKWVLPLNIYHRKRMGFGQQFCPKCLEEDQTPYFRKHWRVAFNTFCTTHRIMHNDKCPQCNYPVMFHRVELGKPNAFNGTPMCICTTCGFDLRNSKQQPISTIDRKSFNMLFSLLESLQMGNHLTLDLDHLNVLRQFCKLINSRVTGDKVCRYLIKQLDLDKDSVISSQIEFERSDLKHRHQTIQLATWILSCWQKIIQSMWEQKVVRYNYLTKDFYEAPEFYLNYCNKYNRRLY